MFEILDMGREDKIKHLEALIGTLELSKEIAKKKLENGEIGLQEYNQIISYKQNSINILEEEFQKIANTVE